MRINKCTCDTYALNMFYGNHHKYGCPMYKKRKKVTPYCDFRRTPGKVANRAHFLLFALACNRGGVKEVRITLSPQYANEICYGYTSRFSVRYTRKYTKSKMHLLQTGIICDAQEYLEEFMKRELKVFHWRINDQTAFGGDVLWIPPKMKR